MTSSITPTSRSGQSELPKGAERAHTLIITFEDRPGSFDRIVGVIRRRRAKMQTLVLAPLSEQDLMRVTVVVNDSEVAIEQLIEQLRKIFDVRQVEHLSEQHAVQRELALIRVNSTPESFNEIIEVAHFFGAHTVDITRETVTIEVTGSREKIEKLVSMLQEYGIREVARSGRAVMRRELIDNEVDLSGEKE